MRTTTTAAAAVAVSAGALPTYVLRARNCSRAPYPCGLNTRCTTIYKTGLAALCTCVTGSYGDPSPRKVRTHSLHPADCDSEHTRSARDILVDLKTFIVL